MGEASPGWRSTTLDTDPVAERTHTALEDWFAKAAIFAATSWSKYQWRLSERTANGKGMLAAFS